MIERLIWPLHNVAKLKGHGIRPEEVVDLAHLDECTVDVRPEYPDQVRITGATRAGRLLTVALHDLGGGVYRPITGWDATEDELRQYRGER
ncbi:MAG: hypothetical protein M3442_10055 [Chloroflexota bacterium]|nr:hypothetical protein [Chloroflexota bacterium]